MKTVVTIEIEHTKPLPSLPSMVAGRAWSIDGVSRAEVVAVDQKPVAVTEPGAEAVSA